MDIIALRKQYEDTLSEAKGLAAVLNDAEKSDEDREAARASFDTAMTRAQAIKADLLRVKDLSAHNDFLTAPTGAKTIQFATQIDAEDDDVPYDGKSWRELEVKGARIRYHVPLSVQGKGYSAALEAYLRKGSLEHLGPNDRKTLSEGTATAGGFLIDEDMQAEVIKKQATMSVFRRLARTIQTGKDMVTMARVNYTDDDKYTSGARLTWTGELPSSSTVHRVTDPIFGKISIPVHTAMASLPVTSDLLEDSDFDLITYVGGLMGEAFALGEDNVFLNGSGAAQPMGLLTQVDGDGPASVASGTSAAISTSGDAWTGKRLVDLYYTVPSQYRAQGSWVMNSATLNAVENLVDAQKRPLISTMVAGGLGTGEPVNIKGRPIYVDEFVPDIAANAYPIIFGDLSGYLIADRVGLSVRRLSEIIAQDNQELILARRRVGGYCIEPWKVKVLKAAA